MTSPREGRQRRLGKLLLAASHFSLKKGSSTRQVELEWFASGNRSWRSTWFADARGSMSVHRRIPDVAQKGAEGRSLTQLGHSGSFGLTG